MNLRSRCSATAAVLRRAPLVIARRALQQSPAGFEAQGNDAILQEGTQYWAVVQARGDLEVQRKSLEAADVSYQHDKRALELGALPPLDIYRSESAVASRRWLAQVFLGERDHLELHTATELDPGINHLERASSGRPFML